MAEARLARLFACVVLSGVMAVGAVAAAPARAEQTRKKAIWGPVDVGGVSQFPIYRELGVGIYETSLRWATVAPTQPADGDDPDDPAYSWPAEIDRAVSEAARYGIQVSITLQGAPGWANGGHGDKWAPENPRTFARFAQAAARRYPTVRHWMIWGEPTRVDNYQPLVPETRGQPLDATQRRAPHRYARLLDAAYGALKRVRRSNIVIGGNSFTTGDISPINWVRNLRLPDGRPPRMDLYGHNAFSARRPRLEAPLLGYGFIDFSDLDLLGREIDRSLVRRGRNERPLRIFVSEFFAPTDHPNHEFNFYVTQDVQASWLKSALRITRNWSRIYTLGWFSLYDDPPQSDGLEVNRGLIAVDGRRKPSYAAYRDG